MKKLKIFFLRILSLSMALCICFAAGYIKAGMDRKSQIMDLKSEANSLRMEAEERMVEIANAVSTITSQKELIKEYECREERSATLNEIRDVNIQLFRKVRVKIRYNEKVPISVISTKWEISPETFGYLTDVNQEIYVEYYFGEVVNHIKIEDDEDKIDISYDNKAFSDPYRILYQRSDLNVGAKLLTSYDSSKTEELIDEVAQNLLSNAEDEYIKKLAEKFSDSSIPVYVNGKNLEDWTESDKIFVAINPVTDVEYSTEVEQ